MKYCYLIDNALSLITERGIITTSEQSVDEGLYVAFIKMNNGTCYMRLGRTKESLLDEFDSGFSYSDYERCNEIGYVPVNHCTVVSDDGLSLTVKNNKIHYEQVEYSFNFRPENMIGVDTKLIHPLTEYIQMDAQIPNKR
ncbi:hypothetical protein OLJ30_001738 [Salmonella enterica]|nr:hypothetical protein [Salmonella enterica subsp. enterica]EKA4644176.1 hypothetical protein [Salmonella enterica]